MSADLERCPACRSEADRYVTRFVCRHCGGRRYVSELEADEIAIDMADDDEYRRDPYRYYGVSRWDF